MAQLISAWLISLRNRVDEGQGLVEYGQILVLVSIAGVVTLGLIGAAISDLLQVAVNAFP